MTNNAVDKAVKTFAIHRKPTNTVTIDTIETLGITTHLWIKLDTPSATEHPTFPQVYIYPNGIGAQKASGGGLVAQGDADAADEDGDPI